MNDGASTSTMLLVFCIILSVIVVGVVTFFNIFVGHSTPTADGGGEVESIPIVIGIICLFIFIVIFEIKIRRKDVKK